MVGVFAAGCLAVVAAFGVGAFAASYAFAVRPKGPSPYLGDAGVRANRLAVLLRKGVGFAKPAARVLLKSRKLSALVCEAVVLCEERGYPTAKEPLTSTALAGSLSLGIAALALTRSPVAAVAVPACSFALAAMAVRSARDARQEAVRESVPEVLRSMGTCFQSGYTLMQTFDQVSREAIGPLKTAFSQAAHLLQAGRPASEALSGLRESTSIPEISFVAVALQVQHEAGGSMRQVLEAARDTVEGELELKRSLRVHTAQAKLSARIVSVMPLVLIALFSVISEGFLEPFFASPAGLALFAVAVGMQGAGIFAVRRMLAMEVAL